jgi:hypothetical protein
MSGMPFAPEPRNEPSVSDQGLFLAPNYVYPCGGDSELCVTDKYRPDIPAFVEACNIFCVDALTRGLLSGLQPVMSTKEPLFGPAW